MPIVNLFLPTVTPIVKPIVTWLLANDLTIDTLSLAFSMTIPVRPDNDDPDDRQS